jgi:2-alkyl-3-oxoalkanoate reductase
MRVFVTGASGVIGRRVVPLLRSAGHQVTAISRSAESKRMLERHGATTIALELYDVAALRDVMREHDAVVNLATHIPSSSTKMLFRRSWRENDRIRREGSAALVDAALAAGVSRFVQESFAPIYADGGERWLDETSPVEPVAYNESVLDAERSAERFAASGRTGVVLRFAAFYGPDSRVMHEMIGLIRKGWSPLPGSRDAFISSVSHDDAASAVVAALSAPSGIYNVSDDEPLRRGEWLDTLARSVGVAPPRPFPQWLVRVGGSLMALLARSLRISNAKFRAATGWAPRDRSVREGWAAVAAARAA